MIEEVKRRLVKVYNPLAIYIFGSYAWGSPSPDSDLDLVIIVKESDEKNYKRPIKGHHVLFGLGIAKDIIVYTEKEFDKRSRDVTTLCYKVKEDGKLLYAQL